MSVVSHKVLGDLTVGDLRELVEGTVRHILEDYTIEPRSYFIDDEGYLCFSNERDYAAYVEKQDRPPSEVRAYFLERGVRVAYSDYEPTPAFASKLDEILDQIGGGIPLREHSDLRARLGV